MLALAGRRPKLSPSSTSESEARTALRKGHSRISARPMIPPKAIRKALLPRLLQTVGLIRLGGHLKAVG